MDTKIISIVAGAGVALLGKIVFDWLKAKKNGNGNGSKLETMILKMKEEIKDLLEKKIGSIYAEFKDVNHTVNDIQNKIVLHTEKITTLEKRIDQIEK